jgi:maltose O-acetyltransferase
MSEKELPPLQIRLVNFILDRVVPHVRWLLFPFWLAAWLGDALRQLTWLLSNEYLKRKLGGCGRGVRLYGRLRLSAPENVFLGDNVHINENAFIRAEGGLRIGSHTHISRNLVLYTMNHQYEGERLPYDEQKILKPVVIGKNVWIGMNVSITPGMTIGDGAIIGLGTLVSKDVPPLAVIGNPPPQIIKQRDALRYQKLDAAGAYSGMSGYPWKDD